MSNSLPPGYLPPRPAALGLSPTQRLSLAPGQITPGNIDLSNRPIVHNLDGSISTVRSISVTDPQGRAWLIPTVIADPRFPGGGRVVSNQRALQHFQQTGQHLGIFRNEDAANAYAQTLHKAQARHYLPLAAQAALKAAYASGPRGKPPP